MATAFLCIAAGATAAPLNPSYRADEFEFYLTDLRAKLLVIAAGKETPAEAVAVKLGVPIARLVAQPEQGAGSSTLEFPASLTAHRCVGASHGGADDIALVLHTSGTTSRPKIVPLAQRNVCASAKNIRETLSLTNKDVGLIVMPLFHIHGLIAALLAPLSAGGTVWCTPGFNALKFFGWLERSEADVVHRRADDASGDSAARAEERGSGREQPAALHPLVVILAAANGARRSRARVPHEGRRGVRHDRSRAPDGEQSAPAARAQTGHGRCRRRTGGSRRRRTGQNRSGRRARRDRHQGRERHDARTRTIRTQTPRRSSTAGSAPATSARWTTRAISRSSAASRRSSIAAAKKSHRAKSTRSSWSIRRCISA